jgi:uncharacterized protein (TIGR02001 family)
MKALSWITNRHVVSALCAAPILLSYGYASAEEVAPAAAEPAPAYTLTYNLGLYSHYMFRGVEYSDGPALQGGIDWAHSSGFYLGTWASNLDPASYGQNKAIGSDGDHVETDFYAGYAHTFQNGVGVNVLGNYYAYLEGKKAHNFDDATNLTGDHKHRINSFEASIALSYSYFTYTYFYIPTNYYGLDKTDNNFNRIKNGDTDGADYNELKVAYPLPFGGLTLGAKVGYQHTPGLEGSEGDYAIGLTRNFSMPGAGKATEGWSANATYTSTFAVQNQAFYLSSEGRDLNESQLTFYIKRAW